ncbi:hypothetical protein BOTBODRAFT_62801 [Botryobasidium botryosum FD-172 SS1]|uniref:Uncharacterized protein n=1 Tax=Botryobasidium botryosum (strain FD-172 SS1) TaxID=930990 RepID=A0A067MUJ5_BOTB1|nr:hypothetical protein BOTBODRAFT_62801 [Botryobasidium botryosum FD-172 SS1]
MATLGGCCFDFMEDGSSVNCPLGYKITSVPLTTDIYPEVIELKSGKRAMGFVHIRPGAETFYVKQDTRYRIDRPGVVSVLFCTPRYSSPARVLSHHALGAIPVGYVQYAFPTPLPSASGNITFPSPSYDNMPTSISSASIQPAALADRVDSVSLHDF